MGCNISSLELLENITHTDLKRKFTEASKKTVLLNNFYTNLVSESPVTDEVAERPPFNDKRSTKLPSAAFGDGKLGVTHEKAVDNIKISIGKGELFLDIEFPANNESLYFANQNDDKVVWKRPKDLVSNPKLFVKDNVGNNVIHGSLGNSWFVSSCATVAMMRPKLIEKVISSDQKLSGLDYKGFIVCRFWRFGNWITVCIDDLLPTKDNKLIYAKCADKNQFWMPLLEKAYAKIHGSYQALEGGYSMDAMIDLTGGVAETFFMKDLHNQRKQFRYISKANETGGLINTSTKKKSGQEDSSVSIFKGIKKGHTYTVSGVAVVEYNKRKGIPLIAIQNSYGNIIEWKEMSDGDRISRFIPNNVRKKLLSDNRFDGEFWMSFVDFYKEFEEVSLCMMGPDFDQDGNKDKVGQVVSLKGEWIPGVNAGGSRNNILNFATNPQFLLKIINILNEDCSESPNTTLVLIELMQEHRQTTKMEVVNLRRISFYVYRSHDLSTKLNENTFIYHCEVGTSGKYINCREVVCRLELHPGYYVIIPATFKPNIEAKFMIRVYSPKQFELTSLD